MTILILHQAVTPPHFTTKLCPWVICYSCLEPAFTVQIWLSVRCPKPLCSPDCEKLKIYVWQLRICVQFICRWQAVVGKYSRLQIASFKSCNLKLFCPEVLLTFFELLCKKCWRWQLYVLQATSDLLVNWNRSFHTSESQQLSISRGRLCDLALKCLESVILCNLTGQGWVYYCLDGIVFFENKWYLICIKILLYNPN